MVSALLLLLLYFFISNLIIIIAINIFVIVFGFNDDATWIR